MYIVDGFAHKAHWPRAVTLLAPVHFLMVRICAVAALRRLQRLDDRMLKDIGLCRNDLDWAAAQHEHADPTLALQAHCRPPRREG